MRKVLILILLFFSASVRAEYNAQIAHFLEREIAVIENAVNRSPEHTVQSVENSLQTPVENSQDRVQSQEDWYFQNFWVRIRARAGIALPFLVKLEIVPEVELLWQRPKPQEWGLYEP